jgi:hypothetical protein
LGGLGDEDAVWQEGAAGGGPVEYVREHCSMGAGSMSGSTIVGMRRTNTLFDPGDNSA